jgi:hypothetical protein
MINLVSSPFGLCTYAQDCILKVIRQIVWRLGLPSNTFAPFHRCWAQFWRCDRWGRQKPCRVRSWPVPLHVFSNHCGPVHVILSRLYLNFILILSKFYPDQTCTRLEIFVISYLLFWPALILRFFLEKKNSAGCLLKTKWLMKICIYRGAHFFFVKLQCLVLELLFIN